MYMCWFVIGCQVKGAFHIDDVSQTDSLHIEEDFNLECRQVARHFTYSLFVLISDMIQTLSVARLPT